MQPCCISMVAMNVQTVLENLRKKSHRLTRSRRAIIEIILRSKAPLTARTVRQQLTAQQIIVNKTTVYRELEFLKKQGIVREVHLLPNIRHFESAYLSHHHHVVCDHCERVIKVTSFTVEHGIHMVNKAMKEDHGFEIARHKLEFYGTCRRCAST